MGKSISGNCCCGCIELLSFGNQQSAANRVGESQGNFCKVDRDLCGLLFSGRLAPVLRMVCSYPPQCRGLGDRHRPSMFLGYIRINILRPGWLNSKLLQSSSSLSYFLHIKVASITWPTAGCGWQPPPLARIVEGTNCRVRTVSLWGAMPIPGAGASKISSEPRGISGGEGRSSDGDGMDSRISKATLKSSQVPLPNSCTV